MRCLVLIAALAACHSTAGEVQLVDAAHAPLDIDVVAMEQSVSLWTHGTDWTCDCHDESMGSAPIGECFTVDDVIDCHCPEPQSCLRTRLVGTGVAQPEPADITPRLYFDVPSPFPPDLALELSGCDRAPMTIPIEPFTAPRATITVDTVDDTITARWQTDIPASSAYVRFGFSVWEYQCHTTASEQAYVAPVTNPEYSYVAVTAFLPEQEVDGELGTVRVWRGADAFVLRETPPMP